MARKWRVRYAGARYHVTARGDGRREIFARQEDCARFLQQLDSALEADGVVLFAYVLMTNHYHLFVETPLGNITRFMQRLNTAYGMYFRYKRRRPGHCFQGRYGAKLVGGEGYALRVTRYIHLNPVWTQSVQARPVGERVAVLKTFPWSSYQGYAGLSAPEERIDYRHLGEMQRRTDAGRRKAYRAYAEGMVGQADELMLAARSRSSYALGSDRFVEEAEDVLKEARLSRAVKGDIEWPLAKRVELDDAIRVVCERLDLAPADLRQDGRPLGNKKGLALEAICRLADASQRSVALALGLKSEITVGSQRRLLMRRMLEQDGLRRQLEALLRPSGHKD